MGWNKLAFTTGAAVARLKELQEEARLKGDYETADKLRLVWMPFQDSMSYLGLKYTEEEDK
ncbi:hypothetical protein [uncultured Roseobacter sp.]|uniref:hypothetical protein n=1 Tax=uncultured Roseobacter sp. TaxID=114847 RepID=UPI00260528DE|nr:hypothetical protein [uncultured Roseobacter sp.]